MLIEARAKVNWSLNITGVRPDGYHLMDMLMQPVTLCDEITLLPAEEITLTTAGEPLLPADEKHLALRAARLLREIAGKPLGASIHVCKHIPVGAGMGGGSADAAAVLWGLNRMWNLNVSAAGLREIGLKLGADVPYCLHGDLTRTRGIGEELKELSGAVSFPLVVIQPCEGLSTKEIFTAWSDRDLPAVPDTEAAIRAFAEGDHRLLFASLANVLQPVSEAIRPEIGEAVRALKEMGASFAMMTGSGSAVFGVYETPEQAASVASVLSGRWAKIWTCNTCRESIRLISDL